MRISCERLVEFGVAEGGDGRLRRDHLGPRVRLQAVVRARIDEVADLLLEAADLGARHAERRQPHGLDLAHGDAAGQLRQVLAEGGAGDHSWPLHLGQTLLGLQPLGPAQYLPQRLHVGVRDPRKPVRRRRRRRRGRR